MINQSECALISEESHDEGEEEEDMDMDIENRE